MSRIRGKLALITGASAGIGTACARRFAADGADLVLWARRKDRLDTLARELGGAGVRVTTAAVDVRDRAAVQAAAATLAVAPDILLNNAGLAVGMAKLHEGDPDDWDRMIDTNLKGLLNVSRAVLPAMLARGTGHVVNIGSTAGRLVYPKGNVYCATKFGVRAISEGMNLDCAGTQVRVSNVDPGYVRTEFSNVRFKGDEARAEHTYDGFHPLAAEDVADVIGYLVNLPAHMYIPDVVVLPAAQRNVYVVDRA
jgi:3-hydroxy acid dehydrogenase / malonic semialdehyde reductase